MISCSQSKESELTDWAKSQWPLTTPLSSSSGKDSQVLDHVWRRSKRVGAAFCQKLLIWSQPLPFVLFPLSATPFINSHPHRVLVRPSGSKSWSSSERSAPTQTRS